MARQFCLPAGVFVLLASLCAVAGIRPSFNLDYSSWHATNIVVVTPVSDDGKFQVLDSWKGDLLPGVVISVPDLKRDAKSQPVEECINDGLAQPFGKKCTSVPVVFTGERIVLYLGDSDKPAQPGKWSAANVFEDMKASAAWIRNNEAYGFVQMMNPGDSVFVHLWYATQTSPDSWKTEQLTEASLKEKTFNILQLKQQIDEVTAIPDPKTRAEALKAFADSKIGPASRFVLEQLGKCGEAAMPTIRAMFDDPKFANNVDSLVAQYVNAGGAAVGPDLKSRFEADVQHWQLIGPSLQPGWWNANDEVNVPPHTGSKRLRYVQTIALIRALHKIHYQPALPTAIQLRDFWRSWPQLNDASGLHQMADEADDLARHLQDLSSESGER